MLIVCTFQITGQLNFTRSTLCTSSSTSVPSSSDTSNIPKRLAVVYRGDCKFAVKAENAAKEGYKGVIVLDTQISTKVDRISGVRSLLTDNIPVIFLLKNEANILENLLRENPNRTATISGKEATHISIPQKMHFFKLTMKEM